MPNKLIGENLYHKKYPILNSQYFKENAFIFFNISDKEFSVGNGELYARKQLVFVEILLSKNIMKIQRKYLLS